MNNNLELVISDANKALEAANKAVTNANKTVNCSSAIDNPMYRVINRLCSAIEENNCLKKKELLLQEQQMAVMQQLNATATANNFNKINDMDGEYSTHKIGFRTKL